jgi:hypothetical protein
MGRARVMRLLSSMCCVCVCVCVCVEEAGGGAGRVQNARFE